MVNIDALKSKVLAGKSHDAEVMAAFLRDMGCVADVFGRDYEVLDEKGEVVFTIRQKGMTIRQYRFLLQAWMELKKIEQKAMRKK